ncbi:putative DNA repair metallo-beta-lactamase [Rosellinia necatrix]|uniref:Putative DNA repair metallo-beta-lactamase n=1 Tax=Rosellinia necatrix TaxID=77044 RepID=A0A1W2TDI5_ROSNE|nr:putative DNA repair metallo-beta-lactamase [Rosellinia necatrix]
MTMPTKSGTPRRPPRQTKLSFLPAAQNANATTPNGKRSNAKPNGNILNFFPKVEVEEQLFLPEPSALVVAESKSRVLSREEDNAGGLFGTEECAREESQETAQNPPKRRKLSRGVSDALQPVAEANGHGLIAQEPEQMDAAAVAAAAASGRNQPRPAKKGRGRGPFMADSDSEEDESGATGRPLPKPASAVATIRPPTPVDKPDALVLPVANSPIDERCLGPLSWPDIQRDHSHNDRFKDLDDMEGFFGEDDDLDESGEEFRERRFMEEQARLEAEHAEDSMEQACPICSTSLDGITSEQATVHVNACLDGDTPSTLGSAPLPLADTVDVPQMSKRFAKAAVPRPGQVNPIDLGGSTDRSASAFTKLMSSHAEDSAWASAAAAEHASKGKPSYQRTCPFYKIMPGFFICVDAFRYGAVKGCNAYFLSHFHSDHYVGLTSNWCHGPIYCSKVTGSLIKNQLRTASKYVKELEFEETVEVPGTDGVTVTMIPANHCPGSSLFLFQKRIGKGPNPRAQRILHCGDFRACPAQVAHPLLKPDIVDAISGKVKQQRIDICYLDTTYLNPRYSFPPQNDVIQACADFCKSLSGDPSAADEAFNGLKREKGSTTVSSFFPKGDSGVTAVPAKTPNLQDDGVGGKAAPRHRLLVVCGTYSIGKERICKAIAQALNTKIFAPASKMRICAQLDDPELAALMTADPQEAQVHMQTLAEIRAETLQAYLDAQKPHFTRVVGFRPSGWNFRPPTAATATGPGTAKSGGGGAPTPGSPLIPTTSILHGEMWRTRFSTRDLAPQRGSTAEAICLGVPYSEHSSFRELALFLMTLRIEKVVPTVNVGSEVSRKRMRAWTDRWLSERRKGGLATVLDEGAGGDLGGTARGISGRKDHGRNGKLTLWDGKDGKGGGVYW